MISSRIALVLIWASFLSTMALRGDETEPILERLPDDLQEKMATLDSELSAIEPKAAGRRGTFWRPGSVVTVAFEVEPQGATDDRCREIAAVADEWTKHGNLKLSYSDDAGKIRRWSEADIEYQADIRVSFDEKGFFSITGRDCREPSIVLPSKRSTNLQGFDGTLRPDWRYYVLHEFGHALGFIHEHKRPDGLCNFLFDPDPGYEKTLVNGRYVNDKNGKRPGLYLLLKGLPNEWNREKVDAQLRILELEKRGLVHTEFDPESIMRYYFPCHYYIEGCKSKCCDACDDGGQLPLALSALDKEGMALAYPTDKDKIAERVKEIEIRDRALAELRARSSSAPSPSPSP